MSRHERGFEWLWEFPWGGGGIIARMGRRNRGRGRGRGNWFGAGDLKYVVLDMLAERPMHGYEVMNALEERTHGCYRPSPGSVYPTLQWLEDEGLVRIVETDGKKVYHVTDAGKAFLDEHRSQVDDIFDRVSDTLRRVVREPMPEVNRAVGKLVKQAYRAAWDLGEDAQPVIEILERAAADIEHLTSS